MRRASLAVWGRARQFIAALESSPFAAVGVAERNFIRRVDALVLTLLCVLVLSITTARAISRPFWHDEIYTALISALPDHRAIWVSLLDAVDANPPIHYYLVRAAQQLVPDDHLAARLPSIVGFLLLILGTHQFLKARVDRLSALAAPTLLLA